MKYLHLIWASLFRRKTRTILTLVSIVAAFLLFGLLDAVRTSFAEASSTTAGMRSFTVSRSERASSTASSTSPAALGRSVWPSGPR